MQITAQVNLAILLYCPRGHAAGVTGDYTSSALYTNIATACMPVSIRIYGIASYIAIAS